MVSAFKQPLTAHDIKARARALGADWSVSPTAPTGTLSAGSTNPRRPSDITELDGGRSSCWRSATPRHRPYRRLERPAQYYNDELTLSRLEEASLEFVYWLEDNGYPAIIVPPTHVDPGRMTATRNAI